MSSQLQNTTSDGESEPAKAKVNVPTGWLTDSRSQPRLCVQYMQRLSCSLHWLFSTFVHTLLIEGQPQHDHRIVRMTTRGGKSFSLQFSLRKWACLPPHGSQLERRKKTPFTLTKFNLCTMHQASSLLIHPPTPKTPRCPTEPDGTSEHVRAWFPEN